MKISAVPSRTSLAELRRIAQPPEYSPSITDRVYRLASIYLSVPLASSGATPNGITVGWIVLGVIGVVCLTAEAMTVRLAGALLLQLSYLLDYVDGEVARLTGQGSPTGEFLDLVGHGLIKASLPLGVGWGAAAVSGTPDYLVAGALGAVAIVVGDSLRFYAACVSGALGAGDLGHVVRPLIPGPRLAVGRIVRSAFSLSFETPGLYGLTLLAVLTDQLGWLALYWMIGGQVWWVGRAWRYAYRLRPERPAASTSR